ncbi:MAG TPA: zf-TFIIB domain-containing protein [Candidatus Hydrogenedentes bacterium]|nr:zf-TFIIB domain-containing protein [Candidatus Hydrogenedentota bacterium]
MKCPACFEILLTLEYQDVEVDYCAACQGVWLDAGELELLLGEARLSKAFLTAGSKAVAAGEKKRLCPLCDDAMDKEVTGGAKPIVYDRCPKGHGLWFDHGELLAVIQSDCTEGDVRTVSLWLQEMFPPSTEQYGVENQPDKGVSS